MRYVNIFFLLFVSTGLTVCCSFCLFCFVLYGDFNFVLSYSMVETRYNMMFGIIGTLIFIQEPFPAIFRSHFVPWGHKQYYSVTLVLRIILYNFSSQKPAILILNCLITSSFVFDRF